MEKIDSRTLPVDALNERRRPAVKMRLDGASLNDTAAQCEMSNRPLNSYRHLELLNRERLVGRTVPIAFDAAPR